MARWMRDELLIISNAEQVFMVLASRAVEASMPPVAVPPSMDELESAVQWEELAAVPAAWSRLEAVGQALHVPIGQRLLRARVTVAVIARLHEPARCSVVRGRRRSTPHPPALREVDPRGELSLGRRSGS